MNNAFLKKLYEINYNALLWNLDGITHADSLREPEPGGNSLNWVLGHLVGTRNRVLGLVGVGPIWPKEQALRYSGRAGADWSPATAVDLETIKSDLARSQKQLLDALQEMSDDALAARPDEKNTVADSLGFFFFHESYHTGQVALLRRLVGKEGVIKAPTPKPPAAATPIAG
jgi:uncharacterized damage-inducible protein DinB